MKKSFLSSDSYSTNGKEFTYFLEFFAVVFMVENTVKNGALPPPTF